MPPRRQQVWNELHQKMSNKRTRNEGHSKKGSASAPHEIIVQRLSSEPNNKQTYHPVQPREFVSFNYNDLTLINLRKACADHFNVPMGSVDVLVSNKGPSATNISQIPHRKDKVYLVRFAIADLQDQEEESYEDESNVSPSTQTGGITTKKQKLIHRPETEYPQSVSIAALLKAGQLVKPKEKRQVTFPIEAFDVKKQEWTSMESLEILVETEKFSSGGFRDAFKGVTLSSHYTQQHTWVVKTYNSNATKAIQETMKSNLEDHTRKQVQMHTAAREITKSFASKVPSNFGACFKYNKVYYTVYNGSPATIEEFVEGYFRKYINNTGKVCKPDDCIDEEEVLIEKAECLVHYSYDSSKKKLMVLDIQGSDYNLYDPEIATEELMCAGSSEIYFCCGNLSTMGINLFKEAHICNKYCKMMKLPLL